MDTFQELIAHMVEDKKLTQEGADQLWRLSDLAKISGIREGLEEQELI